MDRRKRAIPDTDEIPYLDKVAEKDRCLVSLLQSTILLSVLSFIHAFPSTGTWVSDRTKENMAHCSLLLPGVSGFSFIFFSVPADEPKARFKGRMGKLWSFLCTHTIVVMLMSSRVELFDFVDPVTGVMTKTGHKLPALLESFGGIRKATRFVSEVVESLELTSVIPMSRSTKKPRVQEELCSADDDESRGAREQSVRHIRSLLLRTISSGRTEARMHLYRSFLFLIEKILSLKSVDQARARGYEFQFRGAESEDELCIPDVIESSVWDIPRTETEKSPEDDTIRRNVQLLEALASKCPSLSVPWRYKKLVKRRTQDTDDGFP